MKVWDRIIDFRERIEELRKDERVESVICFFKSLFPIKEFLVWKYPNRYLICPNPECRALADYLEVDKFGRRTGLFSCPKCGAYPAGVEFE